MYNKIMVACIGIMLFICFFYGNHNASQPSVIAASQKYEGAFLTKVAQTAREIYVRDINVSSPTITLSAKVKQSFIAAYMFESAKKDFLQDHVEYMK